MISKSVSKACKNFIEKTCHLNIERRYDWKSFIEDPFIRITYDEKVFSLNSNQILLSKIINYIIRLEKN